MKKRLQLLIEQEGLTSAKFAEILSVQPSTISHLLSGRNNPNFDFISRLLIHFPNLNARWLINGAEPMYLSRVSEVIHNEQPSEELNLEFSDNEASLDISIIEVAEKKDFTADTIVNTSTAEITQNSVEITEIPTQIEQTQIPTPPEQPPLTSIPVTPEPKPIVEIPAPTVPASDAPISQSATTAPKKASKIFIIYDNGTFAELERQQD